MKSAYLSDDGSPYATTNALRILIHLLNDAVPCDFTYRHESHSCVAVPSADQAVNRPISAISKIYVPCNPGTADQCARTALMDVGTAVRLRENGHYKEILDVGYIWDIFIAGLLRDVGKTMIPRRLLEKHPLTVAEKAEMGQHAEYSASIASKIFPFPNDHRVLDFIRFHHKCSESERVAEKDGDGAPLASHIIRACGRFDRLVTPRPYKEGVLAPGEALEQLKRLAEKENKHSPPFLLEALDDLVLSENPRDRELMRRVYRGTDAEKYFVDV